MDVSYLTSKENRMIRTASFDITETYRYRLRREWGEGSTLGWVMLNPSTADDCKEDPTIRRCISFAQAWGYSAIEVVNLYALRSTDPRALYSHPLPVGEENNTAIRACRQMVDLMIVAWGVHGERGDRGAEVIKMLKPMGPLYHMGLTASGQPKHPLYLLGSTLPTQYA